MKEDLSRAWGEVAGSMVAGPLLQRGLRRSAVVACSETDGLLLLRVAVATRLVADQLLDRRPEIEDLLSGQVGRPVSLAFIHDPQALPAAEVLEPIAEPTPQSIAYYARLLAQVSLPYTKPPDHEFQRRNGNLVVTIVAPSDVGIPYGTIPRLLLCWITTEAKRTKSRQLSMGRTLSEFLNTVGIERSGGPRGGITRLREQMNRLFNSTINVRWNSEEPGGGLRDLGANRPIVSLWDTWWSWNPDRRDQSALWSSTLTLSEEFFQEVLDHAIPVDALHLRALRRAPLAVDIYVWAAHRVHRLQQRQRISFPALAGQFGGDFERMVDFRRQFRLRLHEVQRVWPDLRAEVSREGLTIYPSPTPISSRRLISLG